MVLTLLSWLSRGSFIGCHMSMSPQGCRCWTSFLQVLILVGMLEDLNQAYEAGIRDYQLWDSSHPCVQGSTTGPAEGQITCMWRLFSHCQPTQEIHRHPMPRPDNFICKFNGGSKQPETARSSGRPATNLVTLWDKLSTRLFPRLTSDLKEVAVYIDKILVSDITVERASSNPKGRVTWVEGNFGREPAFSEPRLHFILLLAATGSFGGE